jgi:HlyD family secretion protein
MANAKSKKRRKIIVFSVIILALIASALVVVFRKREVVITVQTEKAARRSITELVVANGRVQPVLQVVIAPEVSGEIIDLPVKEGQPVKKGDVLVRIKQDNYLAQQRSAEASYQSAVAGRNLAQANLDRAEFEFKRIKELFEKQLVSESQFQEVKTAREVAKASHENSCHQTENAKASRARADDDLAKTIIKAPIDGTVTRLKSQRGERVVGTAMMAGTEIMTIADLNDMEARVEIGEIDIVLIALGQKTRLEVEAFRDRKFSGTVTEIANAAKGLSSAMGSSSSQQEATKFEVKVRIKEVEAFRPGMSVTAEVETRIRTNVLAVPIQSVTTRVPKKPDEKSGKPGSTASTNAPSVTSTNSPPATGTNTAKGPESRKAGEPPKPIEVVFIVEADRVKMVPVKRGISDDTWTEITEGLKEGQEVVSGGYKAINRELEDGKKIKKGIPVEDTEKDKQPNP